MRKKIRKNFYQLHELIEILEKQEHYDFSKAFLTLAYEISDILYELNEMDNYMRDYDP